MIRTVFILVVFLLFSFSVNASDPLEKGEHKSWGFLGPFGTYNKSSLQRGLQVYTEVCSSCHSLKYIAYRNLSDLGYNKEEIKAFSENFTVTDGPNDDGEMFERPGRPSDHFVSPYPNVNAAKAANGGAYPPDLSLITKARGGGADYLYSLLIGYKEAPDSIKVLEGTYYNKYYNGNLIAMPQPLYDDGVVYADGTKANIEQMAADVTEFLSWAAEPEMEERKRTGIAAIAFLLIMAVLSFMAKQQIWANLKKKQA
jgi:ubiquinol-cytochrome c reductase cytochrome c1 subunit